MAMVKTLVFIFLIVNIRFFGHLSAKLVYKKAHRYVAPMLSELSESIDRAKVPGSI